MGSHRLFMELISFDKQESQVNDSDPIVIDKNEMIPYMQRVQKMEEQMKRRINLPVVVKQQF